MTTDPTRTTSWPVDQATAGTVLAIYVIYLVTGRALSTNTLGIELIESVAVILMIVVTVRTAPTPWRTPLLPDRRWLSVLRRHPPAATGVAIVATMLVAPLAQVGVAWLAQLIWPAGNGVTYNSPEFTNNSAFVDIVIAINAGVGEELVYRIGLLAVLARYLPIPVAVVAQAVVFGLAHTGFDHGYGAAAVCGVIAFGIVLAASLRITGSIWPAVVTHVVTDLSIALSDHDLLNGWTFAIFCAATFAVVTAAFYPHLSTRSTTDPI